MQHQETYRIMGIDPGTNYTVSYTHLTLPTNSLV